MSGGHTKVIRRIERLWYIVSSILVVLILLCALILVGLRISGFQMFTITSGSMEPNYPVGSLIYTHPVDASSLKQGDVITFANSESTVVTHRIAEVITETDTNNEATLKFRTKGDANDAADGKLVHYKNIIGTPSIVIPGLGYTAYYLQRPPGIYIALIVCTFLIASIIIPSIVKHKTRKEATAAPAKIPS